MGSALVIVGLVVVLALQIAIHVRIAKMPARLASVKVVTERRERPADDAFQEALARRLNLIVRGVQGYHDQIADEWRIQVAASEQRLRLAEEGREDAVAVAAQLRALVRDMATTAGDLRAREEALAKLVSMAATAGDVRALAEAMTVLAQQLRARHPTAPAPPPDPAPAEKPAAAPEDPDDRKTMEMPPPAPGSSTAPAPVAARTAPATGVDDSWDSEEKTTVKELTPEALRLALGEQPGAPAPRALRPPSMADTDDVAMERPSILPGDRR
jgi:hypothetical protein